MRYQVIKGIFEGTTFNGSELNGRVINENSTGQSFPADNCTPTQTIKELSRRDYIYNDGEQLTYNSEGVNITFDNGRADMFLPFEKVTQIRVYRTGSGDNYLESVATLHNSDFRELTPEQLTAIAKEQLKKVIGTGYLQYSVYPSGYRSCDSFANMLIEETLKNTIQ